MEGPVKGKTFKMKGHTLPGINQRSETKNLADGRSKSSTFQQFTAGMLPPSSAIIEKYKAMQTEQNMPKKSVSTGVPTQFQRGDAYASTSRASQFSD